MRTKRKVELYLSELSHEEQRFATLYGPKALEHRELFLLAKNFHYQIKNNSPVQAGEILLKLFAEAVKKKDFHNVTQFVELLDEWNSEAAVILKGHPVLGFALPFAKDPVGMVLLLASDLEIHLGKPTEDFVCESTRWVRMERIGYTAKQLLKMIKKKDRSFHCDIKTIRNRAKELGVKLLPDKRGLRKGQKRNHVHRVQR